ncbi:precorrin-8X methylmutase [Dehalococcoidia bacterium]|nr:precorrin-8X methylmutase [Dehalococcoidia bacterium]
MKKTGAIILAHGSRNGREVSEILGEISRKVKECLPSHMKLVWAAMQFNHPNLEEAINILVREGVERVVIMPYFLFEGIHVTKDIPDLVNDIKQTYPEVEFVLAKTLGVDEPLIDLVVRRIQEVAPELSPPHSFFMTDHVPHSIEVHSMTIVEDLLPPLECSKEELEVIKRIVHAAGDPQLACLVHFHPNAIFAGMAAIHEGRPIFTDVRMAAVGINRRLVQKFGCSINCALDILKPTEEARSRSTTRAASAIYHLGNRLHGSIVAIGNAPTALHALLDLIDSGAVLPSLVIGMPVGFVQAGESKAELMKRSIPYITIEGTRGGSAVAIATVNALLNLAQQVHR